MMTQPQISRREEFQHKLDLVQKYMQNKGLEAVVLSRRVNFAWLTAGGLNHVATATLSGAAALLITADSVLCIASVIEAPRVAEEELAELGIEVQGHAWHDAAEASSLWSAALRGRPVACDERISGLPEEAASLDADFDKLRWPLTPSEIDRYRVLGREVAEALENACRSARAGMSEHELAAFMMSGFQQRGIRSPVILVAADDRVQRYRHPLPTGQRFRHYGMAVCCGERHGLIVSGTRLFSFGRIPEDLVSRHHAVCQVDAAMIAATRPGRTLGDVFAVAQQAYADAGFPDEWRHHHQGGSTGYATRVIRGAPGNTTPVLLNQAFAWNPSIAGTKSEDTILVGTAGNEVISTTGNWPTSPYAAGSHTWLRNDILET